MRKATSTARIKQISVWLRAFRIRTRLEIFSGARYLYFPPTRCLFGPSLVLASVHGKFLRQSVEHEHGRFEEGACVKVVVCLCEVANFRRRRLWAHTVKYKLAFSQIWHRFSTVDALSLSLSEEWHAVAASWAWEWGRFGIARLRLSETLVIFGRDRRFWCYIMQNDAYREVLICNIWRGHTRVPA